MPEFSFFGRQRLPLFLQSEMAECGLASLAMVAAYHGHKLDLNALRQKYALSLKGATLADLMAIASSLDLACRPLRLELEHLRGLATPAILHWDLNHFVVLKHCHGKGVVIHDPAVGMRHLSWAQVSKHFSGVGLEIAPSAAFKPRQLRTPMRLSDLWSRIVGWKRASVQILLLSGLLQLFALAAPAFLQLVVDEALGHTDAEFLSVLALSFGLMYLTQALTEGLRSWLVLQLGHAVVYQMIGNVLHHLLRLPAAFFEKRMVGDILQRMNSVAPIQRALTHSVLTAIIDGVMALTTGLLMCIYSVKLGAIVLGSALVYGAVLLLLYPLRRMHENEELVAHAEAQSHLIESLRASKTIKLFGREAQREAVWRNHFCKVVEATMGVGKIEILGHSLRSLLFGLQLVLVVYLAAKMIMADQLSVGMLFAFLLYRGSFNERADSLAQRAVEFRLLELHLERLADIVHTPREAGLEHSAPVAATVAGDIELRQVSFRYAQTEPLTLKEISLHIKAGDFVAIIGPSGGGKTTLLKLMLGLLPPTEGEVRIDEKPLAAHSAQGWRSAIGVVQQDDELLMGTLADNIAFFDPELDMARVQASASAAAVHDEIEAMPMGYLSLVGDMGSTLSGGQRQRVLLARALYRQPRLLFLDEGTANLDIETERRVADVVAAMPITRVVIAHRPELVTRAQRVFELRGGHLREITPPPPAEPLPAVAQAVFAS